MSLQKVRKIWIRALQLTLRLLRTITAAAKTDRRTEQTKLQQENPHWREDSIGPSYPTSQGAGVTWKHFGKAETQASP